VAMLANRFCLITGGTSGLGLCLSNLFSKHGATVINCGSSQESVASMCKTEEEGGNTHTYFIAADLSEQNGCMQLVHEVNKLVPKLDVVIHSAGIVGPPKTTLCDFTYSQWRKVQAINVDAPYLLTKELLPLIKKGDSQSIMFVASGIPKKSVSMLRGYGPYAVSKSAVDMLSYTFAEEFKSLQIKVNAINPGPIRTRMRAAAFPNEDPRRLLTPEDISPIFVWLAKQSTMSLYTGMKIHARECVGQNPAEDVLQFKPE